MDFLAKFNFIKVCLSSNSAESIFSGVNQQGFTDNLQFRECSQSLNMNSIELELHQNPINFEFIWTLSKSTHCQGVKKCFVIPVISKRILLNSMSPGELGKRSLEFTEIEKAL